jgi:hypothetical protein
MASRKAELEKLVREQARDAARTTIRNADTKSLDDPNSGTQHERLADSSEVVPTKGRPHGKKYIPRGYELEDIAGRGEQVFLTKPPREWRDVPTAERDLARYLAQELGHFAESHRSRMTEDRRQKLREGMALIHEALDGHRPGQYWKAFLARTIQSEVLWQTEDRARRSRGFPPEHEPQTAQALLEGVRARCHVPSWVTPAVVGEWLDRVSLSGRGRGKKPAEALIDETELLYLKNSSGK